MREIALVRAFPAYKMDAKLFTRNNVRALYYGVESGFICHLNKSCFSHAEKNSMPLNYVYIEIYGAYRTAITLPATYAATPPHRYPFIAVAHAVGCVDCE